MPITCGCVAVLQMLTVAHSDLEWVARVTAALICFWVGPFEGALAGVPAIAGGVTAVASPAMAATLAALMRVTGRKISIV
jgi:hypothetical protein